MKAIKKGIVLFAVWGVSISTVMAQYAATADSTGLPGDHFSLQGALQLFEKAGSPEEFEKLINEENNPVNNLDLNEDGKVDYIRVLDKMQNDAHVLILQTPVSASENQDIAVIEIEKTGDTSAMLQIIGDEDIFGEEIIAEPDGGGDDEGMLNNFNSNNSSGPDAGNAFYQPRFIVNVFFWPSVQFMYRPVYRPWFSPWRWNYYPTAWRPWRPYAYNVWHPRRINYYRTPFIVVTTHRAVRAHRIYSPIRVTSISVRNRNAVAVNNYRVTKSRTTVTGPRGNKSVRKTTTVRGPGGNVRARKTTVRRRRG